MTSQLALSRQCSSSLHTTMDELAELKAQLQEERRRREEADSQLHAERRRREGAEAKVAKQCLEGFLKSCHDVCNLTKPIFDPGLTTTGQISKPENRLFPHRIQPWDDFSLFQTEIWERLSGDESFWTKATLSSPSDFDFLRRHIEPITSETDLIKNQSMTTEFMVKEIFGHIKQNTRIPDLNQGRLTFQGPQFLADRGESLPLESLLGDLESLSISEKQDTSKRNRRVDQLCVWQQDENGAGGLLPIVAIEYKPPHKLTTGIILEGLKSDIYPETDVINVFDDSEEFHRKNAMAAVVTQLFAYMIDIGVRYGYITTGEVYIFLNITADASTVRYHISYPKVDCERDQENWRERTAVAQVFAFVQQALRAKPVDQAWMDLARQKLKRWEVEFYNILEHIPETVRKSKEHSAYEPSQWKRSRDRSIKLRTRRALPRPSRPKGDTDESEEDAPHASPTQQYQSRARTRAQTKAQKSNVQDGGSSTGSTQQRTPLHERPYCSHLCLIGLAEGLDIDPTCPNAILHGAKHLPKKQFLERLYAQLATDRGSDADCQLLHRHGARGAMLKVRLTSHGYTLVAKGVIDSDHAHLSNENAVYNQLTHLQGKCIPVCLGLLTPKLPYHYQAAQLRHLLLLSWAGVSLATITKQDAPAPAAERLISLSTAALKAIHGSGVLHRDAEPRNILYDRRSDSVAFIDFERSRILLPPPPPPPAARKALAERSHNLGTKRKRAKHAGKEGCATEKAVMVAGVRGSDFFVRELSGMRFSFRVAFGDGVQRG